MKIEDRQKRGWFWIENGIFDYGIANQIGSSALIVYFALCRHANREGKSFPSVKKLQFETGLSNKVIANSIDTLKHYNLLEVQREKHQHNLYTIKTVYNSICLNKKEKIASVESTPAQQQVKNLHKASVESTPEHVKNLHEAGVDSTHKGNSLKETHLRTTTTTTNNLSSGEIWEKNSSTSSKEIITRNKKPTILAPVKSVQDSGLVFDSALQDFSSEQKQRALTMLKGVPPEDQQSVLDELNSALFKGTVKSIWQYFNKLIQNYHADQFNPTSELPEKRAKTQSELGQKNIQQNINNCPHCNDEGMLYLEFPSKRFMPKRCNHNHDEIMLFVTKYDAKIASSKSSSRLGYNGK